MRCDRAGVAVPRMRDDDPDRLASQGLDLSLLQPCLDRSAQRLRLSRIPFACNRGGSNIDLICVFAHSKVIVAHPALCGTCSC